MTLKIVEWRGNDDDVDLAPISQIDGQLTEGPIIDKGLNLVTENWKKKKS